MLFSVNVTLGHDDSGYVRLQQKLKLVGRGAASEERAVSVDELAARLRRVGLSVTDERDLVLGSLDVRKGQFIGTTAAEFIRNFVVAAVIKGHYMDNKGYSLPERTSARLTIGKTYSRPELKELFGITDAALNNGTFHVKPYRSVWLFITENKTPDRTQYEDALVGDELRMEGQTEGKTDRLIREHVALGLELLLFYRKSKKEHPHGAFVYEGPFRYVSHEGARPTKFVLRREREAVAVLPPPTGAEKVFDPDNREDTRARSTADVVRRPGQSEFREALLRAYRMCAVTRCEVSAVLDAAHISPHIGEHSDHVQNGILLRADIHRLFDEKLLAVDTKTMTVRISRSLMGTPYQELDGRELHLPADDAARPDTRVLDRHRHEAGL